MTPSFIGREAYLQQLQSQLDEMRATGSGRFVSMRGRRRVGKSRLVEEFLQGSGLPYVFYTATRDSLDEELASFVEDIASSSLPDAAAVAEGVSFRNWQAALTWIGDQATEETPLVIVIDEFPYLVETDSATEAAVQKAWDRTLSRRPVLLILVGSDTSMMEALNEYGRDLHLRPTKEMIIEPFTPWEIGEMLGIDPAAAFDAYLVMGGFPLIAQAWRQAAGLWQFLERELGDPTSPLIVTGERIVRAEFPKQLQAADVLASIGSGERTWTNISEEAGVQAGALDRALDILTKKKRIVRAALPHVPERSKETRYFIDDPYLRFWYRFLRPNLDAIERGRADIVVARIKSDWSTYRGRAIEPLLQRSIEQMLPDARFGAARSVGGYWTRTNGVEVDLTGLEYDGNNRATRTAFIGSVKWRERAAFKRSDTNALNEIAARVPGTDGETLRVGVSRSGFTNSGLDVELTAVDLLEAWKPRR